MFTTHQECDRVLVSSCIDAEVAIDASGNNLDEVVIDVVTWKRERC